MMKTRLLSIILCATLCIVTFQSQAAGFRIAGRSLASWQIVYSTSVEDEEGIEAAQYLQKQIAGATGIELKLTPDTLSSKSGVILFKNTQRETQPTPLKPFDYSVKYGKSGIIIDCGGCWAMNRASEILASDIRSGKVTSKYSVNGTLEGKVVFPRREDANLRILDDNIWEYRRDTIPPVWRELKMDPRDPYRSKEFAQLVRAYMPDVVMLQEYCAHMHPNFYPKIQAYGYVMAYESGMDWNNTPIFYNPETVELLEVNFNLFTPAKYSNNGTKSFTSALFRHKATDRLFAVISTHLWWVDEKVQAGSDMARASQARLIMAEAEEIIAEHKCPVFVCGDLNCQESSIAIQQFLSSGYKPCYKIATEYADLTNGHHECSKYGFSRKYGNRDRERDAIDHCLIYNDNGTVEVKSFICEKAEFTIKLTDHYPNIIDAHLK